ncbi:C-type lectin domain family 5 member A-like isoform X2 [Polypterus senegalus]|uniref:C-type lectin domain family 5 member A-like isoform X2 n=1 Tax=Polypterus senegalus TaxID=55291 RepID=UPI001966775E|nr:C-type lectin domain family 5 member A-like isoform X2 [Polypterus senegalus]
MDRENRQRLFSSFVQPGGSLKYNSWILLFIWIIFWVTAKAAITGVSLIYLSNCCHDSDLTNSPLQNVTDSIKVMNQYFYELTIPESKEDMKRAPTTSAPATSCEDGWNFYRNKCYFVDNRKVNWNENQKNCSYKMSGMVQIMTIKQRDYFSNFKDFVWVGLIKKSEKVWDWLNGNTLNRTIFPEGVQQDKEGNDCVQMGNQQLYAVPCKARSLLACEKTSLS